MNILYLSDNNYVVYMGVSILSLLENNKHLNEINIYVIDDQILEGNKKILQRIVNTYGRKIIFLDMSEGIAKLKMLGAPVYRGSYTTYLKLFAFDLLPNDVHRIFFIDSDTLIVGKLDELDDFDMRGNPVAAVLDNLCIFDKVYLGYDRECVWCNMGVMLVDVDKWKNLKCERKVIEQMQKRCAYVAVDQNILNISLHGYITVLPLKYNVTQHYLAYSYRDFMKNFPMENFYTEMDVSYALENPVVHHFERFIGESPWHKDNITLMNDEFDFYLAKSPWSDYVKLKANVGVFLKIEKVLFKMLPRKVFLKIFTLAYKRYVLNLNRQLEKGMDSISL